MEKGRYYCEKLHPYVIALIVVLVLVKKKVIFINDMNMNNALDGVNTIASLIIGFLGAMLPVILGMKNESKMVRYVFERDTQKLFLKYIKATIRSGLVLVVITVLLYFRETMKTTVKIVISYIWVYFLVVFLLCTYRCLTNILNLVFSKDSDLKKNIRVGNNEPKSKEEILVEQKYNLK